MHRSRELGYQTSQVLARFVRLSSELYESVSFSRKVKEGKIPMKGSRENKIVV